jgi:hypothetical protein
MGTWNHRVVEMASEPEKLLGLREVYYDEKGRPFAHGDPFLCGETPEELRLVLARLLQAIDMPMLKETDFPEESQTDNGTLEER